jgi:predicted enzyme related to lactoylglutathione lyase
MTDHTKNALVWCEIPVTDMEKSVAFYNEVFGFTLTIDNSGPNPMAMFPNKDAMVVAGHLYPGKPATDAQGPTPHLAIPGALEDAIERCTAAGGTMRSPIVAIPPGRFAYAQDLDGNSIALFEVADS